MPQEFRFSKILITQNLCPQSLHLYLLITLLAANIPNISTEATLLPPLITDVFLLPHSGHFTEVSIGSPQFGHALAFDETSFPQAGSYSWYF